MREIYPEMQVVPVVGNILGDLGLGCFRWADVIVGALDNREARVFTNSAAARVGRPWIDGGIEVLQGIVRGFFAPQTACYECTMSQVDWDLLNKRRSCSLLGRRAIAERGVPTTPTSASVIGAIQSQELVKVLHGMDAMLGRGWFFDGANHQSSTVNYLVNPECPWHEEPAPIEALRGFGSDTSLRVLVEAATKALGGLDAIDFSRELVESVECAACQQRTEVWLTAENVDDSQLLCATCGAEGSPRFVHSLPASSEHLQRTPRELGLPQWDVIWARSGMRSMGFEMTADQFDFSSPS
jgi:adenylyltransferase/sulfurtransferase